MSVCNCGNITVKYENHYPRSVSIKSKKSLIKQVKQCLKSGKRSNLIVKKIDDIGIDILKAITKELKIIIK